MRFEPRSNSTRIIIIVGSEVQGETRMRFRSNVRYLRAGGAVISQYRSRRLQKDEPANVDPSTKSAGCLFPVYSRRLFLSANLSSKWCDLLNGRKTRRRIFSSRFPELFSETRHFILFIRFRQRPRDSRCFPLILNFLRARFQLDTYLAREPSGMEEQIKVME